MHLAPPGIETIYQWVSHLPIAVAWALGEEDSISESLVHP